MTRPNCDTLPGLMRHDVDLLFSEAESALAPYSVLLTGMRKDDLFFTPVNPTIEPELVYSGEARQWGFSIVLHGRGETATDAIRNAASNLHKFDGSQTHLALRDWCRAKLVMMEASPSIHWTEPRIDLLRELAHAFGFALKAPDHTTELPAVESTP